MVDCVFLYWSSMVRNSRCIRNVHVLRVKFWPFVTALIFNSFLYFSVFFLFLCVAAFNSLHWQTICFHLIVYTFCPLIDMPVRHSSARSSRILIYDWFDKSKSSPKTDTKRKTKRPKKSKIKREWARCCSKASVRISCSRRSVCGMHNIASKRDGRIKTGNQTCYRSLVDQRTGEIHARSRARARRTHMKWEVHRKRIFYLCTPSSVCGSYKHTTHTQTNTVRLEFEIIFVSIRCDVVGDCSRAHLQAPHTKIWSHSGHIHLEAVYHRLHRHFCCRLIFFVHLLLLRFFVL